MNTLIITEAMLIIKGETTVQLRISAVLLRKAGRWDVPYAIFYSSGIGQITHVCSVQIWKEAFDHFEREPKKFEIL